MLFLGAILTQLQQIQAPLQQTGCLKNHLVHAVQTVPARLLVAY